MTNNDACEIAYRNGYEQGLKDAVAKDNNVPCKWIPADLPPKESGYYLVSYKDKFNGSRKVECDFYAKCAVGEWWTNDFGRTISHWTPLPEPPKEGE